MRSKSTCDPHDQAEGCFKIPLWVDVKVSVGTPLDLVPSCVGYAGLWVVT